MAVDGSAPPPVVERESDDVQDVVPRAIPGAQRALQLAEVYDLVALTLLALVLPPLLLLSAPILSIPLGLIAVLMAPGYALAAAVFVRADDIDGIARLALSFGLSIAVVPLLALLLNFTPWGIQPWPISFSLSFWILATSGVAAWRRWRLSRTLDVAIMIPFRIVRPAEWAIVDRRLRAGIVAGIVLLGATAYIVHLVVTPGPETHLTEFYALGAQGLAEDYPRQARRGTDVPVMLGVNNQEGVSSTYTIEVHADGHVVNRSPAFQLRSGQRVERPIQFRLNMAGDDQEIDIVLVRDGRPGPYRQLTLWLNVQ